MDADPTFTPPTDPEDPNAETPKFPKQKRRHRKPEDEEDDDDLGEEDEAALLLTSVMKRLLRRKKSDGKLRPERGTINRFPPPRAEVASAAVPTDGDGRTSDAAASAVLPKFRPRVIGEPLEAGEDDPHLRRRGFLYFAFAMGLALVAFFAGRFSASPAAAVALPARETAPPPLWQSAFSEPLEKALAADHVGDVATALQLTDTLADAVKQSPALQAYRATLNTRLGHTDQAETDLSRLLGPHTPPDVSYMVNAARAFNYARRREFDHALPCYAAVARVNPFDVANLLHWAEALRRKGDLNDAIDMFHEALTRLPATASPYVEAQREYINYERRLSQIENGHEADVRSELDQHLHAPDPSGYWLMTAAAIALQKTDMPGAVDALNKARTVFPPGQFDALIGDYFFRSFAYRPEMNAFAVAASANLPQARRSSMDYFLDP